jgi:modulator of FtsH protease
MDSSAIAGWSGFLTAAAGSAAALAGLLFVAISINLARVIEIPGVSGRAGEAIILLSGTLASTLAALIPHLSAMQLGIALLVIAVPTWFGPVVMQAQSIRTRTYFRPSYAVSRALLHQAATVPGILAGLSLIGLLPGGMTWLAVGAIFSMLVAIHSAWVLLVEILR